MGPPCPLEDAPPGRAVSALSGPGVGSARPVLGYPGGCSLRAASGHLGTAPWHWGLSVLAPPPQTPLAGVAYVPGTGFGKAPAPLHLDLVLTPQSSDLRAHLCSRLLSSF